MDDAPLVLAHSHARRAAQETAKQHFTAAAGEHDAAAEQYARAGDDMNDIEALRIITLLEEHHHKLAQIVKAKDQYTKRTATATIANAVETAAESAKDEHPVDGAPKAAAPEKPAAPTLAKARDRPSSLAKDIASRRGIPQVKSVRVPSSAVNLSPIQATGRMSGTGQSILDKGRKGDSVGGAKTSTSHGATASDDADTSVAEDGFSRFYSTLTAGPMSKLSSMLAFAGLPLNEAPQEESPTSSKTEKTSARVSTGPDVDQLFSKAALKALKEQKRHPGAVLGPGESFYVIPTSGGTTSYANILNKSQQNRQASGRSEELDEFVDAKEVMTDSDRRAVERIKGEPKPTLREEELHIENAALKQILDKLSHRLQAFESHAQDASMAALAQSMASVRPGPSQANYDRDERMRAMEAQLEREMKEREKLNAENQKQKQVIAKYRTYWDQLKESARQKDKAKKEKAATSS